MWLLINKTLDNESRLLEAGKALCLCQKFEETCKDIVMWLSVTTSLHEQDFQFRSTEHIDYVEKLNNLFLGSSIKSLEQKFGISKDESIILDNARKSRNFICHELLVDMIATSLSNTGKHYSEFSSIKTHIQNIARGDYLVSRWSYEFHERESGNFYDEESYVSRIIHWITNE